MSFIFSRLIACTVVVFASACSQATPPKAGNDPQTPDTAPAANASPGDAASAAGDDDSDAIAAIDCKAIFSPSDAIGILSGPATEISQYPYRDRSCTLQAQDGAGIQIYGGKGDDTTMQLEWNDITRSADAKHYARLDGVGDIAYRNTDGRHADVHARKGALWCDAQGGSPSGGLALARKLGALCQKVFDSGQ